MSLIPVTTIKRRHNGQWHDLSQNAKIYADGTWHDWQQNDKTLVHKDGDWYHMQQQPQRYDIYFNVVIRGVSYPALNPPPKLNVLANELFPSPMVEIPSNMINNPAVDYPNGKINYPPVFICWADNTFDNLCSTYLMSADELGLPSSGNRIAANSYFREQVYSIKFFAPDGTLPPPAQMSDIFIDSRVTLPNYNGVSAVNGNTFLGWRPKNGNPLEIYLPNIPVVNPDNPRAGDTLEFCAVFNE
jgi:hypothetical protein